MTIISSICQELLISYYNIYCIHLLLLYRIIYHVAFVVVVVAVML